MIILLGPKLKHIQSEVQENVKRMMSEQLHMPFSGINGRAQSNSRHFTKPPFLASCSVFGPKGIGVIVRVAAMTTESVYKFLQHQLAGMEPLIGCCPIIEMLGNPFLHANCHRSFVAHAWNRFFRP
ncbi:UREASE ACCESSORY PROTEIN D [Salix viminalis]|uniref:UREASE ACCESSORY PROTEIN D n=1 Tax=Salix viminalis TaxID=40686 RepID=A0A9Q0YYR8_SALVM|nr:UREASE ACCESSORY PROTEIN D [Salix viminalis]